MPLLLRNQMVATSAPTRILVFYLTTHSSTIFPDFQEHYHEHTHDYYDIKPMASQRAGFESDDYNFNDYYYSISDETRITSKLNHGNIVAGDKVQMARIASETRPKNIKVVFIMKCWHLEK